MQVSDTQTFPVHLLNEEDGCGVAVVQSLKDYETENEERAFLRGVVQGLMDMEEGREMNLAEVKKQLGLG